MPEVPADGVLKPTPPEATPVRLPKPLLLKPARVIYNGDDSVVVKHIGNKFAQFNLRRVTKRDLRKLNISSTGFLPLDELLVKEFVPPSSWLCSPEDSPIYIWQTNNTAPPSSALLLNGAQRPEHKQFYDCFQELGADLKNVYHSLRRDLPKEGYSTVRIRSFRKFWITLHQVGTYWDDSLDNLGKEIAKQDMMNSQDNASRVLLEAASDNVNDPTMLVDGYPLDTSDMDDYELPDSDSDMEAQSPGPSTMTLTYTGRRTSTGSRMPVKLSMDLAENFLEPLMYLFGCYFDQKSRSEHNLHIVDSVIPCSNIKFIYSRPKDNSKLRKGILEGPIAVLHAYTYQGSGSIASKASQRVGKKKHETDQDSGSADMDHFFRELKALLLCAQERSRDGKRPIEPGYGEYWSRAYGKWGMATDNGAGDKPGEAVGEPLTDLDLFKLAGIPVPTSELFGSAPQDLLSHPDINMTETMSQAETVLGSGSNGRLDQESGDEEAREESHDSGTLVDSYEDYREDVLAQAATNLPSLEPSTELANSLDESSVSNIASAIDNELTLTPTRKRSFTTFTGHRDGNPTTIESEAVAGPSQSDQNTTTAINHNVEGHNSNQDGVLDIDMEWAIPSTTLAGDNDIDMLSSGPEAHTTNDLFHNSMSHRPRDTTINRPITDPNSEASKQEWYRTKLMEERESQPYEKRKRLAGIAKANKPGRTLFAATSNEYKRIGIGAHDSHDDVSLTTSPPSIKSPQSTIHSLITPPLKQIYLISLTNHHISFIHLRISQRLTEWMSPSPLERRRVRFLEKDTGTWWGLPLRRSKWYNLLDAGDRVEAMKAAWGVFGRMVDDRVAADEIGLMKMGVGNAGGSMV